MRRWVSVMATSDNGVTGGTDATSWPLCRNIVATVMLGLLAFLAGVPCGVSTPKKEECGFS
jgi:hypothetical protein